jgi:transposase
MTSVKYIGMDVHKESISIAVRSRQGNKNDRIDARELSDRLYMNKLSSVYHGGAGVRTLRELARSYLTISKDLARVMSRVKAIYRSWGIPCAGKQVYAPRHRAEWLAKISEVGVRRRAEFYYQQLDALRPLRHEVRRELLAESKKHPATKLLRQIPAIGPIRAALLIALIQTPHRFRTKRPLWKYSGFGIEMHSSADYRKVQGQLQRSRKQVSVRGLNRDCNHDLKNLFKSAATIASVKPGPFQEFYAALLAKGMRPEMARLTLARKMATIVLIVWKRGVSFDAKYLKPQTA